MRERGSKQLAAQRSDDGQPVAPHAGAWIETPNCKRSFKRRTCRSPCGSVDRNNQGATACTTQSRRSPCGSVDRNASISSPTTSPPGRSPCGSVDRNMQSAAHVIHDGASLPMRERGSKLSLGVQFAMKWSRSPCGSVDRNFRSLHTMTSTIVAPHAGAWVETWRTESARPAPKSRSP